MAKVGFWLQGAHGQIAGANLSQSPGGATIMRKNGNPTNPQTKKQCDQRAKFKLMSQIATAFKSVIAIAREGEKSPRNIFTSINFPLVTMNSEYTGDGGQATMNWIGLQLTKSSIPLDPSKVNIDRSQDGVTVTCSDDSLSKVVFVGVRVDDNTGRFVAKEEHIVNVESGQASYHWADGAQPTGVLIYGIIESDGEEASRVKFENYVAEIDSTSTFLDYVRYYLNKGTNVTNTIGFDFNS